MIQKMRVEKTTSKIMTALLLVRTVLITLFLQHAVTPVLSENGSFEDSKNFFFFPEPNARPPPSGTYTPPEKGSGGGHATPNPSHGGGAPPTNCVKPPSGEHHHPTPPSSHDHSSPTSTPPTPTIVTPPVTVTPPRPPIINAPQTPPGREPRFPFDPNSPPFTCTYWRNHPALIWGLLGWWGRVDSAFHTAAGMPGAHINLLQALSNTRTDNIGELYREGTAALLNSMARNSKFPYTTKHVRESFVAALSLNQAASAQAKLFRLANEGRIKL